MLEFRDPIAIGITEGGVDKIFDKAAIIATKVIVFGALFLNIKTEALYS